MPIKDRNHPFFKPLWRRIAIVVVCVGWAGLEFWGGNQLWGGVAIAVVIYALWAFFWVYDPSPQE